MGASADDVARLRRMTNEPTETTYTDELMAAYLEAWPLTDSNGLNPDTGGSSWVEAYDLHAAAADIWEEKAATFQEKHDFQADGASYSANQMYENAMKQANDHRAKQKAQVKRAVNQSTTGTYFSSYANPVFDEDERPDWIDTLE